MDEFAAQERLLNILIDLEFDNKYYPLCLPCDGVNETPLHPEVFMDACDATGLDIRLNKRENFCHFRSAEDPRMGLNFTFHESIIEFIFVFQVEAGYIGGTFASLANECRGQRLGVEDYEHEPPYPQVNFINPETFNRGFNAGLGLYNEIFLEISKTPDFH